jgi:hypothetical protein
MHSSVEIAPPTSLIATYSVEQERPPDRLILIAIHSPRAPPRALV